MCGASGRSPRRLVQDLGQSEKEIESQKKRIEDYRAADDRDEYDVKKQEEVLAEYVAGVADERSRLTKFAEELEMALVRDREPARTRAPRPSRLDALATHERCVLPRSRSAPQEQAQDDADVKATDEYSAAQGNLEKAREAMEKHSSW